MKKTILPVLCAITLASCSGSMSIAEYNDAIVGEQQRFMDQMKLMTKTKNDSALAQARRAGLVAYADVCLTNVDKLKVNGVDKGFKAHFKNMIQYCKTAFAKDYEEIIAVKMSKKAVGADIALADARREEIMNRIKALEAQFLSAQEAFAKANGAELN
ncbi:LIC11966 family surface protein [Edaphocola flava]|jgi:hypothetical protein|uniref:LIC11966 family surface protein n=1 Tax=Edaphocola flava TaxID=2499629 RepID=UPI00100BFE07|nr:hypothetical protein [Edaphocola flava]